MNIAIFEDDKQLHKLIESQILALTKHLSIGNVKFTTEDTVTKKIALLLVNSLAVTKYNLDSKVKNMVQQGSVAIIYTFKSDQFLKSCTLNFRDLSLNINLFNAKLEHVVEALRDILIDQNFYTQNQLQPLYEWLATYKIHTPH